LSGAATRPWTPIANISRGRSSVPRETIILPPPSLVIALTYPVSRELPFLYTAPCIPLRRSIRSGCIRTQRCGDYSKHNWRIDAARHSPIVPVCLALCWITVLSKGDHRAIGTGFFYKLAADDSATLRHWRCASTAPTEQSGVAIGPALLTPC
jgi:hypothetical protein